MEEEVYFEPTRAQKIRKWTIRGLIAAVLLSLFVVLLVRMFISVSTRCDAGFDVYGYDVFGLSCM